MNDAAKWWYYVRQNGGYYPQTVANLGYDVWDWSTLNAGTLFQDSAKTAPATANGDVIGCWTDGVGGVDAMQATTANKPTYATASLNGLPTLSFDGGDLLATGNISISTFAVWVVVKFSTLGTESMLYEHASYTWKRGANVVEIKDQNATATITSTKRTTATIDDTYHILRHESAGTSTTHLMYWDGVLQTLNTIISGDVGNDTKTRSLNIGGRNATTYTITGNIAHLCIVSPYPTDASILVNMESYINGLWGVY